MTNTMQTIGRMELERAEQDAHAAISSIFSRLAALTPAPVGEPSQSVTYRHPSEEHCKDDRVKVGKNLSADGLEILFRLLDEGAGYNSAGRKLSITQTAVKNRKKDWNAAGGLNRQKRLISWVDDVK